MKNDMSRYLPDNKLNIHLFSPKGIYRKGIFKRRDALYYPSEKVVFIVTKWLIGNPSEIAIWTAEEVRLLSSIALSIPEGAGIARFIPSKLQYTEEIHERITDVLTEELTIEADLSSEAVINRCFDIATMMQSTMIDSKISDSYSFNSYESPPDAETDQKLYDNIDLEWGVLMRGLYTLLKSQFLIHPDFFFMEEAFMNLQIAREAAIQIILEHLRYNINPKFTLKDVYKYIRDNFELGKYLVEDLELQHESWIQTKHPSNPFIEDYAPWLMADDVFEPYDALISLYRHIILDEPGRSSMLR